MCACRAESPSLSNAIHAKRASAIAIPKASSFRAIAFLILPDMILTCMIEPANARLSSGWTGIDRTLVRVYPLASEAELPARSVLKH
jgi:hypothetical protein